MLSWNDRRKIREKIETGIEKTNKVQTEIKIKLVLLYYLWTSNTFHRKSPSMKVKKQKNHNKWKRSRSEQKKNRSNQNLINHRQSGKSTEKERERRRKEFGG